MRHASLLLLLLASCQAPAQPGLRTRLIVLGQEFAVGKPLEFGLELTNESPWAMVYDDQRAENGLLITGPDGKEVQDIDQPRQSVGHHRLLEPGETVVLFSELNVEPLYLIVRPGQYQIQFSGGGLSIIDAREVPMLARSARGQPDPSENAEQWFEEIHKLCFKSPLRVPSNIVTVDLKPGRPQESAVLAERLLKIIPEEWSLGVDDLAKEGDVRILLQKLGRLKGEGARVEVLWTRRVIENLGERLCTRDGRNVYASANPKARELWPNFRAKLAEALGP